MKRISLSMLFILPSVVLASKAQLKCEVEKQVLKNIALTQCVQTHAENCVREEIYGYELKPIGVKDLETVFDSEGSGKGYYGHRRAYNKDVVITTWVSPSHTIATLTYLVDGSESRFESTTADNSRAVQFKLSQPTKAANKEGNVVGLSLVCRSIDSK